MIYWDIYCYFHPSEKKFFNLPHICSSMSKKLKYYLKKSIQILIPHQLKIDNIFALFFHNWLIIIIIVFYFRGLNKPRNSFFFSVNNILGTR